MSIREFFWPLLEMPNNIETAQLATRLQQDLQRIHDASVLEDFGTLVDEARRLTDAEADRRKTAEGKATIYLTVVGVLAPILATVTPVILSTSGEVVRSLVSLTIFLVAGLYVLRSGLWAFKTLEVVGSARLDAVDLVEIWGQPHPQIALARGLLGCVRRNRAMVNAKVTCIKMAHALGLRAFAAFVLALIVRAAWEPVATLLNAIF